MYIIHYIIKIQLQKCITFVIIYWSYKEWTLNTQPIKGGKI